MTRTVHRPVELADHGRGTLIENVVVVDSKLRGYVTHASNGVTIRDSVALRIGDAAYWWDGCAPATGGDINASNEVHWDHVYAGKFSYRAWGVRPVSGWGRGGRPVRSGAWCGDRPATAVRLQGSVVAPG